MLQCEHWASDSLVVPADFSEVWISILIHAANIVLCNV